MWEKPVVAFKAGDEVTLVELTEGLSVDLRLELEGIGRFLKENGTSRFAVGRVAHIMPNQMPFVMFGQVGLVVGPELLVKKEAKKEAGNGQT